jgi:hypothetical protein
MPVRNGRFALLRSVAAARLPVALPVIGVTTIVVISITGQLSRSAMV